MLAPIVMASPPKVKRRILAAFDFDHTLVELNTDAEVQKLSPGGKLPEEPFKNLRQRYDQHQDRTNDTASGGRKTQLENVGSILRPGKFRRDPRQLDEEEEMWFNDDDYDDDSNANPSSGQGGGGGGEAGQFHPLLLRKQPQDLLPHCRLPS